jgi:hypothetical protein
MRTEGSAAFAFCQAACSCKFADNTVQREAQCFVQAAEDAIAALQGLDASLRSQDKQASLQQLDGLDMMLSKFIIPPSG